MSGRRVRADWFYYNPYSREEIAEREFERLRNSPRPSRSVNLPIRFNHGVSLPGCVEGDEINGDGSRGRVSGEEVADDDDVVSGRGAGAPIDNAYADELEVHSLGSGQRATTIREFLSDVWLTEASLSGDIPELHGYLLGRLGL